MMRKENKINRKNLVVLVLALMLAATLVACKKPVEENPTSSNSEVVSEVVSESATEEVSEVVSEEISEETAIDLSQYTEANGKKVVDLVADMDYDEFKIIVWRRDVGAVAILSNGDSYQVQDEDDLLTVYFPNEMSDVQSNEYADIYGKTESRCVFHVIGSGENLEVIFTGTDVDGKEYEITVYITKDWKYSWEG